MKLEVAITKKIDLEAQRLLAVTKVGSENLRLVKSATRKLFIKIMLGKSRTADICIL